MSASQRPRLPLLGGSRCIAGMKAQQRIKIQEIRSALMRTGLLMLDEQAKVLGLPRSTAWSVLKPNHKSSGLSARTVNRMLMSPRLPSPVRQKIIEYVREKIDGLYGHSERRRRDFAEVTSRRPIGGGKHKWRKQIAKGGPLPPPPAARLRP